VDLTVARTQALFRDFTGDQVARAVMTVALRQRKLLVRLIAVALAMFGFGYLLPPIYSKVCDLTGFNQLQSADTVPSTTQQGSSRIVLMQFDSNLRDELPWKFRATQATTQVHPGQLVQVSYDVSNNSDRLISGQAIASYAPAGAAAYVRKLECFCFSIQTLAPHEVRKMPVIFVIDPKLPNEVSTVTLSYTFFEVSGRKTPPKEPSI
jgi:cytochrome c oxidase assembly protein subunit 11